VSPSRHSASEPSPTTDPHGTYLSLGPPSTADHPSPVFSSPPGYQYPPPTPTAAPPFPGSWGRAPGQPVGGLARSTQALLAVQLLAGLYSIVVTLHRRSIAQQVISHPGTVSYQTAVSADHAISVMNMVNLVLLLLSGVLFISWLSRARHNVEGWGPQFERHSRGWAVGAWFCPIVNLWYPFQITDDILNDSERGPHDQRSTPPLLRAWWATYLIGNVLLFGASRLPTNTLDALSTRDMVAVGAFVVRTLALALAIMVVGRITAAQTRRVNAT
jgi:Ca2+/Na+ antiporter